ncbi:carbon-nitrogen family hydrolase [soil metagenome]
MHVILCQTGIAWEDRGMNAELVREQIGGVSVEVGDLVVLPEMFASGFTMDVGAAAEEVGGESERFLADLAEETGACVVAGVVTAGAGGRGRNECVAVAPGGQTLCRYRKLHPFSYSGEADYYEAGESVEVFDWGGFVVCPTICYDLRFPELYRAGVDLGADLFTVIANWPAPRHEHWRTLARARAIENQAYVVAVNRAGDDPHHHYKGGSMVVAPTGDILAEAGEDPEALVVRLDPASVAAWREEFPALRDRRPPNSIRQ